MKILTYKKILWISLIKINSISNFLLYINEFRTSNKVLKSYSNNF